MPLKNFVTITAADTSLCLFGGARWVIVSMINLASLNLLNPRLQSARRPAYVRREDQGSWYLQGDDLRTPFFHPWPASMHSPHMWDMLFKRGFPCHFFCSFNYLIVPVIRARQRRISGLFLFFYYYKVNYFLELSWDFLPL